MSQRLALAPTVIPFIYAATTETAKTAFSSLHALPLPGPRGEGALLPRQLLTPLRVRTAMATKHPRNRRSRRIPRKAKKATPPKKKVSSTAKAVYMTAPPAMPSTALTHFGARLVSSSWDRVSLFLHDQNQGVLLPRKYEKIPRTRRAIRNSSRRRNVLRLRMAIPTLAMAGYVDRYG